MKIAAKILAWSFGIDFLKGNGAEFGATCDFRTLAEDRPKTTDPVNFWEEGKPLLRGKQFSKFILVKIKSLDY